MKYAPLLLFVVAPIGLGGIYLWRTPSSQVNRKLVTAIVAFDIAALALAHFVFKAI
jgi:hypothetical protein